MSRPSKSNQGHSRQTVVKQSMNASKQKELFSSCKDKIDGLKAL